MQIAHTCIDCISGFFCESPSCACSYVLILFSRPLHLDFDLLKIMLKMQRIIEFEFGIRPVDKVQNSKNLVPTPVSIL